MIWGSLYFMTTVDLLIMAVGIYVGFRMYQNHKSNPGLGNWNHHVLIASGLVLIALFFLADLLSMWVMPKFIGMKAAMGAMEYLHLNISWFVIPLAICSIAYGFLRVEAELVNRRETLEELVEKRTSELQKTQSELVRKERLSIIGQLTGTVSHELRNPLGAIKSALYVIEKTSDRNNEKMQKALIRADRNIERCTLIIDELLDFTRVSQPSKKMVLFDEWLESIIDEQNITQSIQIVKDFGLKDFEVNMDPDRLRRAVINVIDNACESMPGNNQASVPLAGSQLSFKTSNTNNRIELTVQDNGSGMPENILAKALEPLFSTKSLGVRLGMPTVKQIMEQHDGGIEIDTRQGKGTAVTLWLPINRQ